MLCNDEFTHTSHKIDIFSIGVIIYELYYGRHPYGKPTNKRQLIDSIKSGAVIPNNKIDNDLCIFLKGCLNFDSKDRYDLLQCIKSQFIKDDPE